MRYRLTSGLATRLAAAMAVLCAIPSQVRAWDEDRVSSEIQPYFGVWAGSYMVNTDDLYSVVNDVDQKTLGSDFFLPVLPAGGLSFGVAYSRLHVGINAGYQLVDGNSSGREAQMSTRRWYTKYQYQLFPVDLNVDVALLPNHFPVNLLVGGSAGIGLLGMRSPQAKTYYTEKNGTKTDSVVTTHYNEMNYTNAILATAYVGARINLARRLNLEGQIGWRNLTADAVEMGSVVNGRTSTERYSPSGSDTLVERKFEGIPVNLSGAYFRADLRWTFASKVERDEEQRTVQRVRDVREALALAALRPYRVSAR